MLDTLLIVTYIIILTKQTINKDARYIINWYLHNYTN